MSFVRSAYYSFVWYTTKSISLPSFFFFIFLFRYMRRYMHISILILSIHWWWSLDLFYAQVKENSSAVLILKEWVGNLLSSSATSFFFLILSSYGGGEGHGGHLRIYMSKRGWEQRCQMEVTRRKGYIESSPLLSPRFRCLRWKTLMISMTIIHLLVIISYLLFFLPNCCCGATLSPCFTSFLSVLLCFSFLPISPVWLFLFYIGQLVSDRAVFWRITASPSIYTNLIYIYLFIYSILFSEAPFALRRLFFFFL